GEIGALPLATKSIFKKAQKDSAKNTGMVLAIAVNYGSRDEILRACKALAQLAKNGEVDPADIDEKLFQKHLYTANLPDPDLLIRTSGEMRISNFMLWQIAYSEIYVSELYWPEFDRYKMLDALLAYGRRDRRFGNVK
ncbi:MAG: polyprenyl diphosphate synthase, partial [Coriobacteriales bacterium]|nr:polyprenyl diphosphate synthase [Coriobacteriales bacterium]